MHRTGYETHTADAFTDSLLGQSGLVLGCRRRGEQKPAGCESLIRVVLSLHHEDSTAARVPVHCAHARLVGALGRSWSWSWDHGRSHVRAIGGCGPPLVKGVF